MKERNTNTEVKLCGVASNNIDFFWEEIKPLLIKTLEFCDGKYNIKDIYKGLINKEMQLWIAWQDNKILSYAISQIKIYSNHKRLILAFIGGVEMFKWLHFFNDIHAFAKEHGCEYIDGEGREGWERFVKPLGFKKISTIYSMRI